MTLEAHERLFVALDTPDLDHARKLVRTLAGRVGGYKVGLELFTVGGPELVREIVASGESVFLDLKLHDIPNTVAGAAAAITGLAVSHFTVHAGGGAAMIRRAVEASQSTAAERGLRPPTVLAVTVLTNHDDDELASIGLAGPCGDAVARLAALAREGGVGGLVCSPLEIATARRILPHGELVVPGIRPAAGPRPVRDDQSRVASPGEAVLRGADRLVIGRPITRADDPKEAAAAIAAEIETAVQAGHDNP